MIILTVVFLMIILMCVFFILQSCGPRLSTQARGLAISLNVKHGIRRPNRTSSVLLLIILLSKLIHDATNQFD